MMPLLPIAEEGEGAAAATADSPPAASASSGGSVNLRRACSLSDLNKPNVSRRVLPSPPNNGRKGIASYSSYLPPILLKFSTFLQFKNFLKSRLKSSQVFCMAPPRLYTVHGVYGYIFK
jgi:hypothetical protein